MSGIFNYILKPAIELLEPEISIIKDCWGIPEFSQLSDEQFRKNFAQSEFHLLFTPENKLVSMACINFDFRLNIDAEVYTFAEFVGFVSSEKGKGYGTVLLNKLIHNVRNRNLEVIGFCASPLRPFYERFEIRILPNKARFLREKSGDGWGVPEDDDILDISLTQNKKIIESLNGEKTAYLLI